jgi:glutathione S-transferase
MLTIHHLGKSQSERIIWLCEELGIDYTLTCYARDPVTILAPANFKALHPLGAAPVITDGSLVLAESGAIIDYIIGKYGAGRLSLSPTHPDFAQYLYWFHFANATLQSHMGRNMVLGRLQLAQDNTIALGAKSRLDLAFDLLEARLAGVDAGINGDVNAGANAGAKYLAGNEFTAADIMLVFSLTTMRIFFPFDLAPYPNVKAYLARIGAREAYQRAMHKGDPDMVPMLS